jgi:hypothetical protein
MKNLACEVLVTTVTLVLWIYLVIEVATKLNYPSLV